MKRFWKICGLALLLTCPEIVGAAGIGFETSSFAVQEPVSNMVLVDVSGDGLDDVLWTRDGVIELRLQHATGGFAFQGEPVQLNLSAHSVAWCVTEVQGIGVIHTVTNGSNLKSYRYDATGSALVSTGVTAKDLGAVLPQGLHFLQFMRRVNSDEVFDLVLPGPDGIQIRIGKDGGYGDATTVRQESIREVELETEGNMRAVVGQKVRIPSFLQRDVNGDGHVDLVTEDDARFAVHFGAADGSFARAPSYEVDYEALERADSDNFHDNMNPSNILEGALPKYQVTSRDISGDGREDLVLRRHDRIYVHRAASGRGAAGIDLKKPDQILRVSGNPVMAMLGDENEDEFPDLILARMESLSLSDVLLWFVMSGSIEMRFLIYRNDGERFSRRPDREVVVDITFPNILSMMRGAGELSDVQSEHVLAIDSADLSGTGSPHDTVLVEAKRFLAYLDRSPVGENEGKPGHFQVFLDGIGYTRDEDKYTIDVREISALGDRRRNALLEALADAPPDAVVPLEGVAIPDEVQPVLYVRDLNSDQRDDVLMFFRDGEQGLRGAAFLSREGAPSVTPTGGKAD